MTEQPLDYRETSVLEIYETMSDVARGTPLSGGEVAVWAVDLIESWHPSKFGKPDDAIMKAATQSPFIIPMTGLRSISRYPDIRATKDRPQRHRVG